MDMYSCTEGRYRKMYEKTEKKKMKRQKKYENLQNFS